MENFRGQTPAPGKFPLRHIEISRGEGPSVKCGVPYFVDNWESANSLLANLAKTT